MSGNQRNENRTDDHCAHDHCALSVTGRSGRRYSATPLPHHAPVAGENAVYGLRLDGVWGWVGTADELIASPDSRARFRAFSMAGAALYRLDIVTPESRALNANTLVNSKPVLGPMIATWDLEATVPLSRLTAA